MAPRRGSLPILLLLLTAPCQAGIIDACIRFWGSAPAQHSVKTATKATEDQAHFSSLFSIQGVPYALNLRFSNETGKLGFHPAAASIYGVPYHSPSPIPLIRAKLDLSFVANKTLGPLISPLSFLPFKFSQSAGMPLSTKDIDNLNAIIQKYISAEETKEGFKLTYPTFKRTNEKEVFALDTRYYSVATQPLRIKENGTMTLIEELSSDSRKFDSPEELIDYVEKNRASVKPHSSTIVENFKLDSEYVSPESDRAIVFQEKAPGQVVAQLHSRKNTGELLGTIELANSSKPGFKIERINWGPYPTVSIQYSDRANGLFSEPISKVAYGPR